MGRRERGNDNFPYIVLGVVAGVVLIAALVVSGIDFSLPDTGSVGKSTAIQTDILSTHFAPSNDPHTASSKNYLNVTLGSSVNVTIIQESGVAKQYIYKSGYYSKGNAWQQFSVLGNKVGDWVIGEGNAMIPTTDMSGIEYVIVFVCRNYTGTDGIYCGPKGDGDTYVSTNNWTIASFTVSTPPPCPAYNCSIGALCVGNGTKNPANNCQYCLNTSAARTTWTLNTSCSTASPNCTIGDGSYANGINNSANNCQWCNNATSKTAWTNKSNGVACAGGTCQTGVCTPTASPNCTISGVNYTNGTLNPTNTCQWCNNATSKTAWTPKPGCTAPCAGCTIPGEANTCITNGTSNTANACQWCVNTTKTSWTARTGAACTGGTCSATGVCTPTYTCMNTASQYCGTSGTPGTTAGTGTCASGTTCLACSTGYTFVGFGVNACVKNCDTSAGHFCATIGSTQRNTKNVTLTEEYCTSPQDCFACKSGWNLVNGQCIAGTTACAGCTIPGESNTCITNGTVSGGCKYCDNKTTVSRTQWTYNASTAACTISNNPGTCNGAGTCTPTNAACQSGQALCDTTCTTSAACDRTNNAKCGGDKQWSCIATQSLNYCDDMSKTGLGRCGEVCLSQTACAAYATKTCGAHGEWICEAGSACGMELIPDPEDLHCWSNPTCTTVGTVLGVSNKQYVCVEVTAGTKVWRECGGDQQYACNGACSILSPFICTNDGKCYSTMSAPLGACSSGGWYCGSADQAGCQEKCLSGLTYCLGDTAWPGYCKTNTGTKLCGAPNQSCGGLNQPGCELRCQSPLVYCDDPAKPWAGYCKTKIADCSLAKP